MPIEIARVDWLDPRAVAQRDAMNAETGAMYEKFMDGLTLAEQLAVDDALTIDPDEMLVTLLALDGETVLGHTALRAGPTASSLEVKKVFVGAAARGRGVARLLMDEAETIARERGVASLVLQTGDLQVPAIRLYEDLGYVRIPVYGKYVAMPNALCYRKVLD